MQPSAARWGDEVEFVRFPRTPHLTWLAANPPRNDKVMTVQERCAFLSSSIVIEEKVDGANVGISVVNGVLQAQNRGSVLTRGAHPQFHMLWSWMASRSALLVEGLENLILFGEWCFAVHSLEYDHLPDWFLAFDLYDKSSQRYWTTDRRDAWLLEHHIERVPTIDAGIFQTEALIHKLADSQSQLRHGPPEGFYLRSDGEQWLEGRAKLVRAEFLQGIHKHWTAQRLECNQVIR
jgi:ATP-dependent RNA circularization protein (DNA/RNA ligase family)